MLSVTILLNAAECLLTYKIGIPTFATHKEHREHLLIHLAAFFRQWSRFGFTEGISGHISVRDPEFEHYIWMNPLGKHFGLMAAGDMMCLDVNTGVIVGGNRVISFALLFESNAQVSWVGLIHNNFNN